MLSLRTAFSSSFLCLLGTEVWRRSTWALQVHFRHEQFYNFWYRIWKFVSISLTSRLWPQIRKLRPEIDYVYPPKLCEPVLGLFSMANPWKNSSETFTQLSHLVGSESTITLHLPASVDWHCNRYQKLRSKYLQKDWSTWSEVQPSKKFHISLEKFAKKSHKITKSEMSVHDLKRLWTYHVTDQRRPRWPSKYRWTFSPFLWLCTVVCTLNWVNFLFFCVAKKILCEPMRVLIVGRARRAWHFL